MTTSPSPEFFRRLAAAAAAETLPRFRQGGDVINKYQTGFDQVTEADRAAEQAIRGIISAEFPDHGIVGEEYGTEREESRHQWVIDPIDGTRAFIYGIPLFSTLIAYVEKGEPIVGVISFPAISTVVYAAKGQGCYLKTHNGLSRRLTLGTDAPKEVANAVISTSGIHSSTYNQREGTTIYHRDRVVRCARDFIFANDAYQHAMVATGRLHGAIDTIMKPWDSAALIPCIREAGGDVCSLSGERDNVMFSGSLLSASTPELAEQLVKLMNP